MLAFEIVARCPTVWGVRTVPYSQVSTATPGGYRADCSGYVSAVLGLPAPGLSTVGLAAVATAISWGELAPGDLLGEDPDGPGPIGGLGPGTEGDAGHVAIYTGRSADGGYQVWEQSGGQWGPHQSTWGQQYTESTFRPYRYTSMEENMAADPETILWLTTGAAVDGSGYLNPAKVPDGPTRWAAVQATQHNLAAIEQRLAGQIAAGFTSLGKAIAAAGGITPDGLTQLLDQVTAAAERGAAEALDGATLTIHAGGPQ